MVEIISKEKYDLTFVENVTKRRLGQLMLAQGWTNKVFQTVTFEIQRAKRMSYIDMLMNEVFDFNNNIVL